MKKKIAFLIFLLLFLGSSFLTFDFGVPFVKANLPDCSNPSSFNSDYDRQYCDIQKIKDMYFPAQETNKKNLSDLQSQLSGLNQKIADIAIQLDNFEKDITKREEDMAFTREVFNRKARDQYTFLRLYDPITPFLSVSGAAEAFREINFRQRVADSDRKTIDQYAQDIVGLKNDKETLEKSRADLAIVQKQVTDKANFLAGEVAKVDAYLATLSAQQQSILAAKFASAPVPLLAYTSLRGCSSDIGKSTSFSPRYGFFSYGVPNKIGLNQYGALGRAQAGQPYGQILDAYYANFQIADYGTGYSITVNGTNDYGQTFNNQTMNIEDYLKHLYEIPTNWPVEALRAQAIAARSYALARTNNGQTSIPPDQSGQEVKAELNSQEWINAVNDTAGKVMVQGGKPISAWYSSTHGGVVLKSSQIGWSDSSWTKQAIDTPSGAAGGFSELRDGAYDKQSPWFFCDWGYRSQYNNTAWLQESEVVDIVNAYILWNIDHSTIVHLSQTDKPTSDTWSADQVRQEILNRGGTPISSVNSIYVPWDSSGISGSISVNGASYDAQKFKNLFNLRAPANIQIQPACQPDSGLGCNKMYSLFEVIKE